MDIRHSKFEDVTSFRKTGRNTKTYASPERDETKNMKEKACSVGISHQLQIFYEIFNIRNITLDLACFCTFWATLFNFLKYFVWLKISDEGSVPEMRICSILLIKSKLKWCINLNHTSRSLLLLSSHNSVGGDIVTRSFVGGWVSERVRPSVTLHLVDRITTTLFA